MFAPIDGEVPIAVGEKEFGPVGFIDFSVGAEGDVEVGAGSVLLVLHAETSPIAATAEMPIPAAIRRNAIRLPTTSTPRF